MNALEYGMRMCEDTMNTFPSNAIPPNIGWFTYHHGVFLSGMERIYKLTGDRKFYEYIKGWVDSVTLPDGTIRPVKSDWCTLKTLDFRQAGILLFNLYKETKDEKYSKILKMLVETLKEYPTNSKGGFWHFEYQPYQMWLDSLYMCGPLMVMYAKEFDRPEFYDMAACQAIVMYENMRDENGLLHHGWDESKAEKWADSVTGLSPEVWGRAFGWVVVAISDILDYLPEDHPKRARLIEIERELIATIVKYQSEDGRWYQIIDKGDMEGNWLENSCSCLFTYAITKCVRKGLIDESYMEYAKRGYEGVINTLTEENGKIILGDICVGTGVDDGTYEYYIARQRCQNDLHGTGAFVLMCSEYYKKESQNA